MKKTALRGRKMKRWKELIKFFLFFSLPVVFSFLGQASLTDKLLTGLSYRPDQIRTMKDYCCLAGIILTFLPLGITYRHNVISTMECRREHGFLLQQLKVYFMAAIRGLNPAAVINIRIFTPKWPLLNKIGMGSSIRFISRNINGLTDDSIKDDLEFRVFPNPQGLVGKCYSQKKMFFDSNLQTSPQDYNLDEYQKAKIFGTKFCACVPIFNKKAEVTAVIMYDSRYEINMTPSGQKKMFSMLYKFSNEIGENLKSLFKRGGTYE